MKLSVVVTTLNDRESLVTCLDAIASQLPSEGELIVVNGPSTDGTTGTVRERGDVDVLVEISERTRSVARNAGIEAATGDAIAFVHPEYTVESGWYTAIETALATGADVLTGPLKRTDEANVETDPVTIAGRSITMYTSGNVAFDRDVLDRLDGFDEYLTRSSTRDCAHRIADAGYTVTWSGEMAVRGDPTGNSRTVDWGARYRSLAYRLAKNYGPRPTVFGRTIASGLMDGFSDARGLISGETTPTAWIRNGIDVVGNSVTGLKDGLVTRYRDRSIRRNPNGVSSRHDRAVQVYDRR